MHVLSGVQLVGPASPLLLIGTHLLILLIVICEQSYLTAYLDYSLPV